MSKKEDSKRRPATGPRIALAQIAPTLGDSAANLEQHRSAVKQAVAEGCDLVVFPELSLAGYRLKDSVPDVAIKRGSDTWKELEKLSEDVALVVGFVEESADHLFYNAAGYFEGGKCLSVHRKTYLPTYGMFDEQRYFARGRSIAAFDTKCGRVAMLVCEDMLHPSALTIAACDGATLIVVPSASPARGVTTDAEADSNARSWEGYLQVMARSFGVWVAYCNRVGVEDGVSFWGGSELVSPAGERVTKAAYYEEEIISAVASDDAVRRRRIVNPLVRDEDLDLTINELSRIRGRDVVKTASDEKKTAPREKPAFDKPREAASFDGPPRERGGFDGPRAGFDKGPRDGFDKPAGKRFPSGDGEGPPRRFDRPAPPRGGSNRDDDRPGGFRPSGPFQERGGPARPRFNNPGDDKPRFGGPPRGREDGPRGGFGGPPRGREDGPRGGFGGPPRSRDDGPPRGGFGGPPRGREDGPRGGFGGPPRGGGFGGPPRGREDGPRGGGGFGGPPRGRDDAPRGAGGFGGPARGRDDAPRGGGFGPPRGGGFGPPRPGFGASPRGRDSEGGGTFGKGGGSPRERQRPEPARKPFHKGAKPRGRKDD